MFSLEKSDIEPGIETQAGYPFLWRLLNRPGGIVLAGHRTRASGLDRPAARRPSPASTRLMVAPGFASSNFASRCLGQKSMMVLFLLVLPIASIGLVEGPSWAHCQCPAAGASRDHKLRVSLFPPLLAGLSRPDQSLPTLRGAIPRCLVQAKNGD